MPRETEVRFSVARRLAPEVVEALGAGAEEAAACESVYFDTGGRDLERGHAELRLRRRNGTLVQTVKTAHAGNDVFTREEHETPLGDFQPNIAHARAHLPAHLREAVSAAALRPRFRTNFARVSHPIRTNSFTAEASFDVGVIEADDRRQQISEVEFELGDGALDGYAQACLGFLDKVPAALQVESKAARGYRLAAGEPPRPVFARRLALTPELALPQAIRLLMRHNFAHFLHNHPAVTGNGEPESIHQMRVGMRRLRSALQAFKPVLTLEQAAPLIDEIKAVFALLGHVREADVFLSETVPAAAAAGLGEGLEAVLREEVGRWREEACGRVRAALVSRDFARLAVRLNRWIEEGEWLGADADARPRLAGSAIGEFALPRVRKLHGALLRRGRKARHGNLDDWHRARIAAKKLRYAGEPLLGAIAPAGANRKLAKRLAALQTTLGHLNDLNTITSFLERVGARASVTRRRELVAAGQFCRGWSAARAGALIGEAEAAMKRFEKTPLVTA